MSMDQWVNLPREDKFVADSITERKRLDYVRISVRFQKDILSGYRVRILKVGGDDFEDYEANEKRRNINFQIRGMPGVLTNDGETEVTCAYNIYLNAAGDNEYSVEATHNGRTVTAPLTYRSRRKLFYQVMKMRGCPTTSMAVMETEFWKPANKHYIEMKKMGAESTVTFIPCLDGDNAAEFINASADGYTLMTHKPFAFGMTFVNYIATPETKTITRSVSHTLPSTDSRRRLGTLRWEVDVGSKLWFELDPTDDENKRWYRRIRLWFEPDDDPTAREYVRIRRSMVEPTGPAHGSFGGRTKLTIRFPAHRIERNESTGRAGQWKVSMRLICVRGFSGGFAYTGINLLAIATKSWWNTKDLSRAAKTVIHEVGHKVGMVAHGDRAATGSTPAQISASQARKATLPNSHSNLYGDIRGTNDQDHRGPHCTNGATWDGTQPRGQRWSGSPGCVMFGANAISGNSAPTAFCSDCSEIVRKLDLTGASLRLGGFRVSMDEYD